MTTVRQTTVRIFPGRRTRRTLVGPFVMLLVTLWGCADRSTSLPRDTLRLAACCGEQVMSPAMDVGEKLFVFSTLVELDARGEAVPELARSWEVSEDHRSFIFHLDRRFRWHDGTPVTAEDVAFTLELMLKPEVSMLGPGPIENVRAVDDSTVVITHTRPVDVGQFWSWYVMFPRHLLEDLDPKEFYDWEFWTHPIGSGPYRYVRHDSQVMMALEAVEDYPLADLRIPRVVLKFSESAQMTDLLAGEIDIAHGLDSDQVRRLSQDPRFRAYHTFHPYLAEALTWDNAHPLFRDRRVREAIVRAVDRRSLLRSLGLPEDTPVLDGIYTNRQIRQGRLPASLEADPDSARALLESAGWLDEDGDGIREREGEPFAFDVLVAGEELRAIAVLLQDALRKVGLGMEIVLLDRFVARERMDAREAPALLDRVGNAPGGLVERYGGESRSRYDNPAVARIVAEAAEEPVPPLRDSLYSEASRLMRDDLPLLWLWPRVTHTVAHRRVEGLRNGLGGPAAVIDELALQGGS